MPVSPADLPDFLQKLFTGHGVDASIQGSWVTLNKPYCRCRAVVANEMPHATAVVVQLDVLVFIGFGQLVVESFAGIGATRDEAVANALEAFVTGSFHVILAAVFHPDRPDEQVERAEWPIGGRTRAVTIGGGIYKGVGGPQPQTFDVRWVEQFRERLSREDLPPGTHWVRIYHAQDGGRTEECEVLLDNATWPTLQADARKFDWPRSDGFSSVRLFLIIQSEPNVADLAAVIAETRGANDGGLFDALVRRGAAPAVADQVVALVPLAFGRVMLAHLPTKFPAEAIVMRDGASERTIRLDANPIFRAATRLAGDGLEHQTMSPEAFESIALRSAEVQVMNDALHAGSKPQNLAFATPILMATHDWEPDPAPTPTPAPPARRKKPWWRFW